MATAKEVSKELIDDINSLSNEILREVALDTLTRTKKRIFTDGLNSDLEPIGDYTPNTVNIKKKKGRFTSPKVNLRDTETLVNSYVVEPTKDGYDIGFISASSKGVTNTDKIKKIKEKYGEVFNTTSDEDKAIDSLIHRML